MAASGWLQGGFRVASGGFRRLQVASGGFRWLPYFCPPWRSIASRASLCSCRLTWRQVLLEQLHSRHMWVQSGQKRAEHRTSGKRSKQTDVAEGAKNATARTCNPHSIEASCSLRPMLSESRPALPPLPVTFPHQARGLRWTPRVSHTQKSRKDPGATSEASAYLCPFGTGLWLSLHRNWRPTGLTRLAQGPAS